MTSKLNAAKLSAMTNPQQSGLLPARLPRLSPILKDGGLAIVGEQRRKLVFGALAASLVRVPATALIPGERFVGLAEAGRRLAASRSKLWRLQKDRKIPRAYTDPGGRRKGWLESHFQQILRSLKKS